MAVNTAFAQEVHDGLSATPKSLPSKWFYDEVGDALFVEIMHMPEYYLTRAELEIFTDRTAELVQALGVDPNTRFELVELGAGDGTKTKHLLRHLLEAGFDFAYLPIDISQHALDDLESALAKELPGLDVQTRQGDYFGVLAGMKASDAPKVVLFLGSNLGNLLDQRARNFMGQLSGALQPGDAVLLGLDLIKPVEQVLPAYNDAAGITRRFNLNLLTRINRELGGNFNLEHWEHRPEYTQEEGVARSFLQSTCAQIVTIDALDASYSFVAGERIHTEVSRKYNQTILEDVLQGSGLSITGRITDRAERFADFILRK